MLTGIAGDDSRILRPIVIVVTAIVIHSSNTLKEQTNLQFTTTERDAAGWMKVTVSQPFSIRERRGEDTAAAVRKRFAFPLA
jgi:hypothetical protein